MAQHENTGGLWTNQKQEHPRAPAYIGSINIKGEVYNISAWVIEKTGEQDKRPDISITVNQQQLGKVKKDDDVPF